LLFLFCATYIRRHSRQRLPGKLLN
jgi:hypothetical protein